MLPWPGTAAWCAVVAFLALFPARFLLWGTDVSWSKRGYRFAWRVLLNEKTGMVTYRVVEEGTGRTWTVEPGDELTPAQLGQLRTQPDLIRDHARIVGRRFAEEGHAVAVYADTMCSLNGRKAVPLLRDDVDLTQEWAALEAQGWITPHPDRQDVGAER